MRTKKNMNDIKNIKNEIVILQDKINKKVLECDSLSNDELYILSSKLDCLINQWNRLHFSKGFIHHPLQ